MYNVCMNKVKQFALDFVGMCMFIMGTGLIVLSEIITQIMHMLEKLWFHVMIPIAIELLMDVHFMGLIALQAWFECSGTCALAMSATLLKYVQWAHGKSEMLMERTWMR